MPQQTYANHKQTVFGFHVVLLPLIALTLLASIVNVGLTIYAHHGRYDSLLIFLIAICLAMAAVFGRMFALKAQDRAIRAEESLRHFMLTGKPIDARLSMGQIIALRFAPDDELLLLAPRAAAEQLSPDAIKRAVKNWRADTYRV